MLGEAVPDTMAFARLIAKVMTFVADALEAAVSSPRTSAANDPVEAPAASEKPAPSATEMEEAPASVAVIVNASIGGMPSARGVVSAAVIDALDPFSRLRPARLHR